MVMGGDSRSEGRGFKSRCRILDGQFFTCCIDVNLKKTENKRKRGRVGPFSKKAAASTFWETFFIDRLFLFISFATFKYFLVRLNPIESNGDNLYSNTSHYGVRSLGYQIPGITWFSQEFLVKNL